MNYNTIFTKNQDLNPGARRKKKTIKRGRPISPAVVLAGGEPASGDRAIVPGDRAIVPGDRAIVSGEKGSVPGEDESVSGEREPMSGEDEPIPAEGEAVQC